MAQHQRKLLAVKRSNKTLWAAIVGSGAVHAFFFGSSIISPAPQIKPQAYPVIFAELRHEQPQQAQLQQQQSQPVLEKTPNEQVPAPLESALIESEQSTQSKPSSQTTTSKTPKKPVAKKEPAESAATTKPVAEKSESEPQPTADSTEEKTALDKTEQSGLAISKDMLSSDPFELEYQQKVLAHLRKTLLAPKHYSGSVRVEIRFSYRQIATDVKVVISSGNPFFDEWAVKAILVANPFPPVPQELGDDYVFRPTLKVGP